MDIRKQNKSPQQALPAEDPVIGWIKRNRDKIIPHNSGSVIQKTESGQLSRVQNLSPDEQTRAIREAEELNRVVQQGRTKVVQPLQIPDVIDFDRLPPEKQQEILESIDYAQDKLDSVGLGQGKLSTLGNPELKQSAQPPSTQPNKQPQMSSGAYASGGWKPTWASKPQPIPEAAEPMPSNNPGLPPEFAQGPNIHEFMTSLSEEPEQSESEPEQPASVGVTQQSGAGGVQTPTNCQHCGWELNRPDPEDPSELDKLNFIQSVLGQIPFRKRVHLLGGRVEVEFRTLASEESDMVFTQVAYDVSAGDILDEVKYFRTIADYRLCLGLARLRTGDVSHTLPDSVDDWSTDELKPKSTKLAQIVPWIYENILKSEPLRRAVAAAYFRFQRFVERMEAHIDDSNFWPAIEKHV